MTFDFGARYAGTVSADASSIQGEWILGRAAPLDLHRATAGAAWSLDSSPLKTRFVTVEQGIKLEVLDWGGTGRPVILLAGLGNTAHVFDRLAPELAKWYHVYGITRRGFGASSAPAPGYPATGYDVDRLGKDVVAVMDALQIDRPVLVGHSIAGEELSDVGSRYPGKIAGLIYLDAAEPYAFYDASAKTMTDLGYWPDDFDVLRRKLAQLPLMLFTGNREEDSALIDQILTADLPRVRTDLETWKRELPPAGAQPVAIPPVLRSPINQAIALSGAARFTFVKVPILAIFADPHADPNASRQTPAQVAAFDARDKAFAEAYIAVVERDAPQAHIVRIAHANHYVFFSNESEVLSDIHRFIQALPP